MHLHVAYLVPIGSRSGAVSRERADPLGGRGRRGGGERDGRHGLVAPLPRTRAWRACKAASVKMWRVCPCSSAVPWRWGWRAPRVLYTAPTVFRKVQSAAPCARWGAKKAQCAKSDCIVRQRTAPSCTHVKYKIIDGTRSRALQIVALTKALLRGQSSIMNVSTNLRLGTRRLATYARALPW